MKREDLSKEQVELSAGEGHCQDDVCMIPVSCKGELKGLSCLKKEILKIVNNKELCPILEKEIPESWIKFEERVKSLAIEGGIPIMTVTRLAEIAADEFSFTLNMMLSSLNYLNSIGSLAYFRSVEQVKHLVFLDLTWLVEMLQFLFRHDHDTKLVYSTNFMKFDVMESQFEQDKEQLLSSGNLSKSLLR